jgi:Protein of unknown function (DUF3300)
MIAMTSRVLAGALLLALPHAALAQTQPAAAPAQQLLSKAQLDALVSPIALYPDALLSEILIASTYPLEVVEADRWAQANKNLKGDALKAAADKQSWDDSVKSLTATPDVLDMMSNKLTWTQQLGDAVLAQQPDVMDAIQRLRTKAQANNKLVSSQQQTVSTQQQDGRQVIVIAPTDPDMIYVPYYDPAVVYGPWPYSDYPPYYWPPPAYIGVAVIATGLAFGAGYALGRWAHGGYRWGGGFNWGGNNIHVNRSISATNVNVNNWTHNPAHRQGVRYNNPGVAAKFGGTANVRGGGQNRLDSRGSGGQHVLQPGGGGNRSNVGGGGGNAVSTNRAAGHIGPGNASARKQTHVQSHAGRTNLGGGGGGGHNRGGGGGVRAHGGGGGGGAARAHTGGGATARGGGGARAHGGGGRRR